MALSGLQDVGQILEMGSKILPQPVTHAANGLLQTFTACSRFWLLVYATWLLVMDMFFTIFPTTIIFVSVMSIALHYTRLPPPPTQFVHAVLGVDPNVELQAAMNQSESGPTTSGALAGAFQGFASSAMQSTLGALKNGNGNWPRNNLLEKATNKLLQKGPKRNVGSGGGGGFATPVPDSTQEEEEVVPVKGNVMVIAKRGAAHDAPENTLGAFEFCKRNRCHFVHFDVRLSADNVAVVFHDEDLIRMAGINKKIKDMTADQIKRAPLKDQHHRGGQKIPDLEAAVEKCIRLNLKFVVNIVEADNAIVGAICNAYKRYKQMYSMALIMSFHWKIIYSIRKRDPQILGCVASPYEQRFGIPAENFSILQTGRHINWVGIHMVDTFSDLYDNLADWFLDNFLWWYIGLSAIIVEKDILSKKFVADWRAKGIHVFAWPVDLPAEKAYCNEVLQIGYLTNSIVDDPVLRVSPEGCSLEHKHKLPHNVGVERRKDNPPRDGIKGRKRSQSPDLSSTDNEMKSIPPSPTSSEFISHAYHTLAAAAGKLQEHDGKRKVHGLRTPDLDEPELESVASPRDLTRKRR